MEAICNNAVYTRESTGHLPEFYYLVFWKGYLETENTQEPYSAVQHLRKHINFFDKNHSNNPTAISKAIDTAPAMGRPMIKPRAKPTALKQKQSQLSGNSTNKQTKKNLTAFGFYRVFGFFEVQVIYALKFLAWKSYDFFNQPNY